VKQIKETFIALLSVVSMAFVTIGFICGWIGINIHVGYLWAEKIMSKLGEHND
jgi:hypothetical protein